MTKLMQWLSIVVLFFSIWATLLSGHIALPLSSALKDVIFMMPIYLVMAFACCSLVVIGYRVATFNDCVEASEELKKQIKEAQQDLRSRGLKI